MKSRINTVLIGAQKSGTTTIWHWLSQHPDIYAPVVMKDYHFFSRSEFYNKGLEHLHSFYSDWKGQRIVLQGGVNYYCENEFGARILKYNPTCRYLLLLRNPIDRAWSAYKYFRRLGQETRAFSDAIADELAGKIVDEDKHRYAYLDHGLYHKHVSSLWGDLDRESISILLYEEVFAEPKKYLKSILNFLEVDCNRKIDLDVNRNRSQAVKYQYLNNLMFSQTGIVGFVKRTIPIQKLIPLSKRIEMGNYVRDKNVTDEREIEEMPEECYLMLKDFFLDPNKKLEELLDRSLQQIWG